MRALPLIFALAPMLMLRGFAADADEAPSTEKLKDTVREWIETMREVQQEENDWERDQELLQAQRDGLETEIAELKKQLEVARQEKAGADSKSVDKVKKRDALAAAKDALAADVRKLEESLVAKLPGFPAPLAGDPRVKELMEQVRKDVQLTGEDAKGGLTKRLNNVLNLLSEAEKWQQTVHLKDELHETGDGRKFNMKVVYFGLGCAYAVDDAGEFALVGVPGEAGWTFSERNDLAPTIQQMVAVLNGDADAQFISLPIELP
jgi:hypothetical protein